MNDVSGAPAPLRRRVDTGMNGFFALKRLNTSPIASMRAEPPAWNARLTRRFN